MPKGGRRQTLLFTATWSNSIERLATQLLARTHVRVTVGGSRDGRSDRPVANKAVKQVVHVVDPGDKWRAFKDLLAPFKVCSRVSQSRTPSRATRG